MPNASAKPTAVRPALAAGSFAPILGRENSRLRKVAESYLGVPYHFGGQSRSGIDCSGFVRQVFSEAYGIDLPHNALAMSLQGNAVAKRDLKPGDLIFFKHFWIIDHTGIYMGNNYFIHSATSIGVAYSSLEAPYFVDHYAGARRIPGITKL